MAIGPVYELAARQGWLITRDQVLSCGMTDGMIRHRLRTGELTHIGRGRYRVSHTAAGFDGLLRAAVVVLPGAVVSHHAAAQLLDIPFMRRGVVSVTVDASTTHDFPDVVVHRNRDLAEHHIDDVDELPCTTVARTMVDLAGVCHPRQLQRMLDELLVQRKVTVGEVVAVLNEVARRGKPGVAALRELLNRRGDGAFATATAIEKLGLTVIRRFGLPEPELQYPIPWDADRRFDIAYPLPRVAVEWDGRRWHSREEDFERDRARDRLATVHDWRLLRFTWADLRSRPFLVAAQIGAALHIELPSNI
jgi:hypothetical protein